MTADAAARILTIGHSTRTLAEFTDLLEWNGVGHVVDVRRLPGSARWARHAGVPTRRWRAPWPRWA